MIVETILELLFSGPLAYWRLDELTGTTAVDASGNDHHARYEPGTAPCLEGPFSARFSGPHATNRGPHFSGGRVRVTMKELDDTYSVAMWFCNALPADARDVRSSLRV